MEKIAYTYNPESCCYIGTEYVQESPREHGVYLLPSNCTLVEPLPYKDGFNVVFDVLRDKWFYNVDDSIYIRLCDEEIYWRDSELARTDVYMISDYPIGIISRMRLKKYRKRLRDWPKNNSFPDTDKRPQCPL